MVEFLLNSSVNSETGFSAFELHFGSEELTHFYLPTGLPSASQNPSDYLKKLNTNLEHLWSLSQKHHATVQAKRKAITKEELNQYSPGDLVLMRREDPKNRDKKLDTPYLGPYLVKSHEGNTVQIQHLASHLVSSRHVERFKPFWGTLEQGMQLARTDLDHFVVLEILAYRGDIETRTSLDFLLRYVSGKELWHRWDQELFATIPYEEFCRSRLELSLLLYPLKESTKMASTIRKTPILYPTPGTIVFLDLRFFGNANWYDALGLPDHLRTRYLYRVRCGPLRKKGLEIEVHVLLTREIFYLNALDAYLWLRCPSKPSTGAVQLTAAHLRKYPIMTQRPVTIEAASEAQHPSATDVVPVSV
jgi:hypothetical protein